MTHPSHHARTTPDKIAYQMAGSGKAITYRELDELSKRGWIEEPPRDGADSDQGK